MFKAFSKNKEHEKKAKSSIKAWAIGIISFVLLTVIIYAGTLLWFIWPISDLSLDRSGLFGDSFGLLTSFFSGLAFSGMLIAILLQREELKLQREELEKSTEAQQLNAKLTALNSILSEYKAQIEINEKALSNQVSSQAFLDGNPIAKEQQLLFKNKNTILCEIESILISHGINLQLK